MTFWVYLLLCADGSYYTGSTGNLELRLAQHQNATNPSCYTATRLPVKLVYAEDFHTRRAAFAAERQIKGWSRKKKQALIRRDWLEILRLSNAKNPAHGSGKP
ncbi:MAG: GIY-YIG nuclease family protein [Verrucomicrobiales bacterium]|jgi:predicted GIY-YIG superfamily endonuclease|nr:GIY-YIG nuclease family protein [Verrucomicrobiales bacterium]